MYLCSDSGSYCILYIFDLIRIQTVYCVSIRRYKNVFTALFVIQNKVGYIWLDTKVLHVFSILDTKINNNQ